MHGELSIISGCSNPALAEGIAKVAGVPLSDRNIERFSDGEIFVELGENVRGHDVFVVQSTSTPGNDYLMELLILLDALRRSSAERITAVLPYFGYARQDRKTKPRVPIAAKLVADLIVCAGAHRVLTMELHAGQIMGFFNIPVDNLFARKVFLPAIRARLTEDVCVVSPDAGGVERARGYATRLGADLAVIDKRRDRKNIVQEMRVVGDVVGRQALIVDDLVDTGGTLVHAAEALLKNGATEVLACCTHAVLSGSARSILPSSPLSALFVSDTVARAPFPAPEGWLSVLSVAELIGEAILRIHRDQSVSSLFGEE